MDCLSQSMNFKMERNFTGSFLSADVVTLSPPLNITATSAENATKECTNDYCVSEEEYFDMILDYIFPSPLEWCLILTYTVVFIVGLVGNFLVCFAVWRNHSMRTVTNYFIVNLAVADFLVILICLPPTVLGDVTETWYMGSIMCKIVIYLQGVSVSVSVLTLSSISLDRWYAICQPLKFKSTPTRAKYMICMIWVISLAILVPELVALDVHLKFPANVTFLLTSCKPTWSYTSQEAYQLFLIIAMYALPFLLMFVCYFQIARCLWSNTIPSETSRDQLHPCDTKSSAEIHQLKTRRKAAKMLIAVVVMFGICYLPVHLLNILRYSGALEHTAGGSIVFALIAHWLCYFNSAINPVIYNFMSAKFRSEFQKVCACSTSAYRKKQEVTGYSYKYSNTVRTGADKMTMTVVTRQHLAPVRT